MIFVTTQYDSLTIFYRKRFYRWYGLCAIRAGSQGGRQLMPRLRFFGTRGLLVCCLHCFTTRSQQLAQLDTPHQYYLHVFISFVDMALVSLWSVVEVVDDRRHDCSFWVCVGFMYAVCDVYVLTDDSCLYLIRSTNSIISWSSFCWYGFCTITSIFWGSRWLANETTINECACMPLAHSK